MGQQASAAQQVDYARFAAPSALTIGALVSGLTAVKCASEHNFQAAATFILSACVLDGLDGHVARYLDACTKMGFELDSLCDCANFGVVPALVVYFWAKALPQEDCSGVDCSWENNLVWAACCYYCACCALRLARFNVAGHAAVMDQAYEQQNGVKKPPVPKVVLHNLLQPKLYFRGIPAPMGAAYALTPMMLDLCAASHHVAKVFSFGRRATAVLLVITATFMGSTLPTFSSKMLKTESKDTHLRSRHKGSVATKAVLAAVFMFLLWRWPFDVILGLNFAHLLSIPVSVTIYYTHVKDVKHA